MTNATPLASRCWDDRDARILDTLIWQSLTTHHARFAEGGDLARRFDPEVAGFVAIADDTPAAWAALADLVGPGEQVLLSRGDESNRRRAGCARAAVMATR